MASEFQRITVEKDGEVAIVTMLDHWEEKGESRDLHHPTEKIHMTKEVADAIENLRRDSSIRVIVLTGSGQTFKVPPADYSKPEGGKYSKNDPRYLWEGMINGIIRGHQAMAECEKPIVARVNGDAIGLGQSLMFASDIIIAEENAKIVDHHLSMGEIDGMRMEYGIVPGDGGSALLPLFMPPTLAKEYLMLGKPYRASELAEMGLINYAVAEDELDTKTAEIVERLLERSAYALAWAKRTANRRVINHLNMTLDAAAAYEMVNFYQIEWLDWDDPKKLTWEDDENMDGVKWSGNIDV